jgi:hypothetical protein
MEAPGLSSTRAGDLQAAGPGGAAQTTIAHQFHRHELLFGEENGDREDNSALVGFAHHHDPQRLSAPASGKVAEVNLARRLQ